MNPLLNNPNFNYPSRSSDIFEDKMRRLWQSAFSFFPFFSLKDSYCLASYNLYSSNALKLNKIINFA